MFLCVLEIGSLSHQGLPHLAVLVGHRLASRLQPRRRLGLNPLLLAVGRQRLLNRQPQLQTLAMTPLQLLPQCLDSLLPRLQRPRLGPQVLTQSRYLLTLLLTLLLPVLTCRRQALLVLQKRSFGGAGLLLQALEALLE